ncbi:MAG: hypothetical protein R8P61_15075 [Bacteroidia bacterium]|nr:hypothetical protein [Bacteroidia bacterium]
MLRNLRIYFIATVLVLGLSASALFAQIPEVISMRDVGVKEGADTEMLEKMSKHGAKQLAEKSEGMFFALLMGNRGQRKGKYMHSYAFATKEQRDHYFPKEGADAPQHTQDLFNSISFPGDQNPNSFLEGGELYTDYVILGYDQMEAPKGGAVVSIHLLEVAEGKEAEFEKMVTESIHPLWQKNIEGMYIYVLKGDRGARKGKYIQMMMFDSMERRDAYFPVEGEGFSEELAKQITDELWPAKKFEALGMSSSGYTDYHFVSR